jgi:hypothetical protein
MATFFIDAQGFYLGDDMIIKELCIMDANKMLDPLHLVFKPIAPWDCFSESMKTTNEYLMKHYHKLIWYEGTTTFCASCILSNYDKDIKKATFYVLDSEGGSKMKTLKLNFPKLRFISYNKTIKDLPEVPPNICCPYRDHGKHCAYKQCLSMCVDYCKSY